ncbi:MAG TPA: phage tail protein [Ilumatobacteraceae bacterium]
MPISRDHPYEASNFLVDLGAGDPGSVGAQFFQVEIPDAIVDEVVFRSGNDKAADSHKQPGLVKYGQLVLRRDLLGSTDLWDWWKQAREGQRDVDRNVTVTLLDEERAPVWTWHFRNAFPVKYATSPLDAHGNDVVVEELTLTFDSLDIE